MKYVVYKLNPISLQWGIYDSTFCQVDAIAIKDALLEQGYQAYIHRELAND